MSPRYSQRRILRQLAVPVLVLSGACGAVPEPATFRLVDRFQSDAVANSPQAVESPARFEWRFDGSTPELQAFAETGGFEAGPGVEDLAIRDGRLVGSATTTTPLLRVDRVGGRDEEDELHAIEVASVCRPAVRCRWRLRPTRR